MNKIHNSEANKEISFSNHSKFLIIVIVLFIPFFILFNFIDEPQLVLKNYYHFLILGLIGAIVANSTGAGGGIVFIPAFTALGVSGLSALGTSLAIQCFGMTAGALSWLYAMHKGCFGQRSVLLLSLKLIAISGIASVIGMLIAQYILPTPSWPIGTLFKYFSIAFGLALLAVVLKRRSSDSSHQRVRRRDLPLIVLVSFGGGIITSWLSIGAGEWLAILLFLLGYPAMVVVCVAVCISSLVVLSGIPYHIFITESVEWYIVLFAAPAAIIGGTIARYLSNWLGPLRLKLFFSLWVLGSGLFM